MIKFNERGRHCYTTLMKAEMNKIPTQKHDDEKKIRVPDPSSSFVAATPVTMPRTKKNN